MRFAWLNSWCFKVYHAAYMLLTLLEYVVRVANNIRSKFSEFSIEYNTNLHKMAQECTPEVTSRQMNFLTALRE